MKLTATNQGVAVGSVGLRSAQTQQAGRARSLLTAAQWRSVAEALRLSGREFQIVQGIFDDMKELAIALELGISSHTVHTYVERIYRKIGIRSRCELLVQIFAAYIRSSAGGDDAAFLPQR